MPDLTQLYIFLAACLLAYGSYKDMQDYEIPYITIIGVGLLGVFNHYVQHRQVFDSFVLSLLITGGLLIISKIFAAYKQKPVLGYGDIQLFFVCTLWIEIEEIPLFFVSTGIAGVLYSYIRPVPVYIPLCSCISLSWFVVIVLLR